MSIPGVGRICASAIQAFAPPMASFRRGRDFSAWLGLVPRQNSTGGKPRLGRISKMGQRDVRRLLIIGAMTVVRWALRRGAAPGSWLARMLARKPRMLVAVALANRMARIAWALMTKKQVYKEPGCLAARSGGVEVYRVERMELRQGDRVRWTRNDKDLGLVNSQTAEVTSVKDDRALDLTAGDAQLRHVDRAWASTVHAFQGRTVDTVIAAMEANHPKLTNQKTLYVEISRARDRAELVTDDAKALCERLEAATGERIAALEALGGGGCHGRGKVQGSAGIGRATNAQDGEGPIGAHNRNIGKRFRTLSNQID